MVESKFNLPNRKQLLMWFSVVENENPGLSTCCDGVATVFFVFPFNLLVTSVTIFPEVRSEVFLDILPEAMGIFRIFYRLRSLFTVHSYV